MKNILLILLLPLSIVATAQTKKVVVIGTRGGSTPITLTTTGTSGASTLIGSALNIPVSAGTVYTANAPIIVSGSVISADTTTRYTGLATIGKAVGDSNALRSGINANTAAIQLRYDSLRRLPGNVQVEGRKNGVWYPAFIDSTGGGGAGSYLLANGGTLTGANTITGSTNNTIKFDFPSYSSSATQNPFTISSPLTYPNPRFQLLIKNTELGTSPIGQAGIEFQAYDGTAINPYGWVGITDASWGTTTNAIGGIPAYTGNSPGPYTNATYLENNSSGGIVLLSDIAGIKYYTKGYLNDVNYRGGITANGEWHVESQQGQQGLVLNQVSNNTQASISYVPINFTNNGGLQGQFLATAPNYSSAGVNLAANSLGLLAENPNGQLSMIAGGTSGIFTVNTGGYAAANERLRISSAGLLKFNAYGAGTLTTDASGNITATSDERLKTNIKPATYGLIELMKLKPITYSWNKKSGNETKGTYLGFSAQNVKASIPYGTGEMKDGYLTLQDRAIMATMTNSIKELYEIILKLKSEIVELKKKVN